VAVFGPTARSNVIDDEFSVDFPGEVGLAQGWRETGLLPFRAIYVQGAGPSNRDRLRFRRRHRFVSFVVTAARM